MSKIDELIKKLCPGGVEFRLLSEIFDSRNGYTPSKSKPEFWEDGTVPWFRMEDIRAEGHILTNALQYVNEAALKQSGPFPAGSIIVATSATVGDHALVTVDCLANQRFTCLTLKPEYRNNFSIKFLFYYCFLLDDYCKQNLNQGNFVSVSMAAFYRFKFPVPPMEVQEEIVRVLDSFTELEAELEAELEKRKKQYAYYRDHLLNSEEEKGVKWVTLGDIGTIVTGLSGKSKSDFVNTGNARYATYKNIFDNVALDLSSLEPVVVNAGEKQNELRKGDILFTGSSETPEEVGMTSVLLETPDFPVYLNSFCFALRPKDTVELSADYSKHLMRSHAVRKQIIGTANGVTRFNVSKHRLLKVRIPLPSLEKQKELANTLDQFDVLVNDLSEGLPAEIDARHKQYEYYRDQLLTFDELAAA